MYKALLAVSETNRKGLGYYREFHFVPTDKEKKGTVSKTLEYAYDDWCIAQLAKELGKNDDYQLFMKRAGNYKNLWDSKNQFMRPKMTDGSFLEALNGREQDIVKVGEHSYY
ncbi:MAG: glycoside hydrolase family 92 protein, partial [Bacteroidetes bacterium]|nr:glycoside hydrolase family 92 protein [Bacteroidota bacterium]